MAEEESAPDAGAEEGSKKGGKGMLFGIVGAVLLGGGGFFAAFSGMLPIGGGAPEETHDAAPVHAMIVSAQPEFVAIEGLVISLGLHARSKHLKFGAQLEVESGQAEAVEHLRPRILDVMNTFLRAVEEQDFERPSQMAWIRGQLLHRVRFVVGEGMVKDLLITEFVLN